jgi:2-deoxy-D-gluconate 3-dehydrogenase
MNPFDLQGKVALVTGGNGGIGLGMAKGLSQAGATVVIAGRDADKNASALKALGGKASSVQGDLKDEKSCRRIVEEAAHKAGRLDILVNNAGINIRKAPQDLPFESWREVLAVNLDSAFVCSQVAHPHFKRAGAGKVVELHGTSAKLWVARFAKLAVIRTAAATRGSFPSRVAVAAAIS